MIPASYLFKTAYDRAWRDNRQTTAGPGQRLLKWVRRLGLRPGRRHKLAALRRRMPAE